MKKVIVILIVSIFTFISFSGNAVYCQNGDSSSVQEIVYYVSPLSSKTPALGTNDSPFFSLDEARDAIRENRKKNQNFNKRYRVVLLSGTYNINNSFKLSEKDSGTVNNPIIYEGDKTGKTILSGGIIIPVKSCKKISIQTRRYNDISPEIRKNVYSVNLKEFFPTGIKQKDSIDKNQNLFVAPLELCINGTLMTLARYPNTGFIYTGLNKDSLTFEFANELIIKWINEPSIQLQGYLKNGWSFSINKVSKINDNSITLQKKPQYGLGNNRPFFVSNLLSELDVPNEYYIDYDNSILYLILPLGTELSTSSLELSTFGEGNKSFIEATNTSNITIRNITFTLGRFGALNLNKGNHIILSDLEITNMGNFGVKATGINYHFSHLHINNVGGSGINLSGGDRQNLTSSNNLIEKCNIEKVCRILRTYNPAISIDGVGNVIQNCQISNLPHIAIIFKGNENLIDKNEIFNVCNETSDAGAIYTGRDWGSQGNVLKNNFIHDIKSNNSLDKGGVHAIYLDDCASGINVTDNILNNIAGIGILIGGGRDNLVTNNIISNCSYFAVKADSRGKTSINQKINDSWNLREKIEKLKYKSSIWTNKYPKLSRIFDDGDEKSKLPFGSEVKNNVMWNNKKNFDISAVIKFNCMIFSNNIELEKSPFTSENIKVWKFNSGILKILPKGFIPIKISEIGLVN